MPYCRQRAAFLICVFLLELNGLRFTTFEEAAAQAILSLAAGTLDEPALTPWFRANAKRPSSPEIKNRAARRSDLLST